MRPFCLALLLTFLVASLTSPVLGQNEAARERSALAGTWEQPANPPEFRLEIDTAATVDTLRLFLMGRHTPEGIHQETIVCVLGESASQPLVVSHCPLTTLARKAPPRDSSLHFEPQSKAEQGLRRVVDQFIEAPVRNGDSLAMGAEERFWLVKQP